MNRALVDPNSDAWKKLQEKFGGIEDGQVAYNRAIGQIANGSPAMAIANAEATKVSLKEQSEFANTEGAVLGQIRKL